MSVVIHSAWGWSPLVFYLFWSQPFLIQVFLTRLSFLTKVHATYNRLPQKNALIQNKFKMVYTNRYRRGFENASWWLCPFRQREHLIKNMYVEVLHYIIFCEDVVGVEAVKNWVIHATSGREWVGYDGLLSHAWNFPSLKALRFSICSLLKSTVPKFK